MKQSRICPICGSALASYGDLEEYCFTCGYPVWTSTITVYRVCPMCFGAGMLKTSSGWTDVGGATCTICRGNGWIQSKKPVFYYDG